MFSLSTRNGGDEMDPSIVNSVKKEYNLVIDDRTAKELKIRIGCADQIEGEIGL
jgi:rod shape-determining protein MreB